MKKLLTTLFATFTVAMYSQSIPCSADITIYEIEKDTLFQGDSLWMGFRVNYPTCYPDNDTAYVILMFPPKNELLVIWKKNSKALNNVPTYKNPKFGPGLLFKAYLIIPKNTTPGEVSIYDGANHMIYVKPKANGIDEYFKNKKVKTVKYFTVLGQEIQSPEGLVIEQKIYTDNTSEQRKVYFTQ